MESKLRIGIDQPSIQLLHGLTQRWHNNINGNLSFFGFEIHVRFQHGLDLFVAHGKQQAHVAAKLMRKPVRTLTWLDVGFVGCRAWDAA